MLRRTDLRERFFAERERAQNRAYEHYVMGRVFCEDWPTPTEPFDNLMDAVEAAPFWVQCPRRNTHWSNRRT